MRTALLLLGMLLTTLVQAAELNTLYIKTNPSVVVLHTIETIALPNQLDNKTSLDSLGSAVLVSDDGLLLSAAHVVQVADNITAEFVSGERIKAKIIAAAPAADLALLKLSHLPKNPVIAKLGDSGKTRVGDQIYVIGAPFGIAHTLTVGYISARHQPNMLAGGFSKGEFFQTDAAINQGNSGGPLFNMQGEVIGIVSHIRSRSGGFEGLGFAVSINSAKELLLKPRPIWSGMEGYFLSDALARIFNLPQPNGILVQRVASNSPASHIGLRGGTTIAVIDEEEILIGGDVILSVAGIAVQDDSSLDRINAALRRLKRKEKLSIVILRGGKIIELKEAVK